MNRRIFILAAAAVAAGCTRQSDRTAATTTENVPLGLQLYTVRELMEQDVVATLELVAGIGYQEVEFAGYFDIPPEEMKKHLADAGLDAPSTHIGYEEFARDAEAVVDHALAVGHRFIVVPAVPESERATLDDYRRHAENFNRWSEACVAAGLRFGYHNHMYEFDRIDGKIPYDLLLESTDPAKVEMELDLAWARGGHADPLAYFRAWPGRFPLIHIKDLDGSGNEVDVGSGDVAFSKVFEHKAQAGLEHGFIERDHAADVRESIKQNHAAIQPLWNRYMK